jgi:hypothetical protein
MGGAGTGGADQTGGADGAGGTPEPPMVSCGGRSYLEPAVATDWGCEEFDDTWPPTAPWELTQTAGTLTLSQVPLVSSPNALLLDVPTDGTADAKLSWQNAAGDDITEMLLSFQVNPPPQGAPALWEVPLQFGCIRFGNVEGCVEYQRGDGFYGLRISNHSGVTIPTLCSMGGLTEGSWNEVTMTLDNKGLFTVTFEGADPVECQGPGSVVGTVGQAWVGMESAVGARTDWDVSLEDVFVRIERE